MYKFINFSHYIHNEYKSVFYDEFKLREPNSLIANSNCALSKFDFLPPL